MQREARGHRFDVTLDADLVLPVSRLITGLGQSPGGEAEHRQRCLRKRLLRDGLLHAL